jgi:outer membrane protein assembly factor BamB
MQQHLSRRSVLKGFGAWTFALFLDGCGGGNSNFSRNGLGLATSSWPKYRGNLRNTGQTAGRGATGKLKPWSTAAGTADRVEGSAIIGPDGSVYIGADDGRVYAFNGITGAILWSTIVQTAGVDSTPVLGADGLLYVGAGHSVVALVAANGVQKWRFATAGDVESAPALAPDGTLYFGADDAKVYAVHSSSGSLKWAFAFPDNSTTDSSPALGADGMVYIGSDKGTLYALDGQRGALKWSFQAIGEISGAPAIGIDGTVYICALNSAKTESVTYAINGESGLQRWSVTHASQSAPSVAIGMDGTVYGSGVALTSIIDGVVVEQRAMVWAIDGNTAIQKWEQGLEPGSPGVTAVSTGASGILYVQSERPTSLGGMGNLSALDPLTGSILWEFATGGSSNSSPAIGADGTVYVGSDDGRVYAIRQSPLL